MDDIVIRELDSSEHDLLANAGLFGEVGLPDLGHARVIVGQDTVSGKLIAYWVVFDAVHVEPLWIAESHRKRPGLARRLWGGVQKILLECKVPMAFAMLADGSAANVLPMASRLGFKRIPGSLYFVILKPENWKEMDQKLGEFFDGNGAVSQADGCASPSADDSAPPAPPLQES